MKRKKILAGLLALGISFSNINKADATENFKLNLDENNPSDVETDYDSEDEKLENEKKLALDKIYQMESYLTAMTCRDYIARVNEATTSEELRTIFQELIAKEKETNDYYSLLKKIENQESLINKRKDLSNDEKEDIISKLYRVRSEDELNKIINGIKEEPEDPSSEEKPSKNDPSEPDAKNEESYTKEDPVIVEEESNDSNSSFVGKIENIKDKKKEKKVVIKKKIDNKKKKIAKDLKKSKNDSSTKKDDNSVEITISSTEKTKNNNKSKEKGNVVLLGIGAVALASGFIIYKKKNKMI